MKKKLLSGIFALALLIATGYGVNRSVKSGAGLSDLALSNVEALAGNENSGTTWGCDPSNTIVCYWDGNNNRHYGLFKWI